MSVLVRELESLLGFPLFERTTRKVTLTEFGSKLLPIADHSLLELEAAAAPMPARLRIQIPNNTAPQRTRLHCAPLA